MKWTLNKRGEIVYFDKPIIMAIVNLTPNSFYATSRVNSEKDFMNRVENCITDGATILDIGSEASNPKALPIDIEEEWQRLEKYLKLVNKYFPNLLLSIDTRHAEIIRRALNITAVDIVNDISGCRDKNMPSLLAEKGLAYVLTYVDAIPSDTTFSTMRANMLFWLAKQKQALNDIGVVDVLVDPGFGFNKNIEQNYSILSNLRELAMVDSPVLVGVSRKRMLYELLHTKPEEVGAVTSVLHYVALQQGCSILRVHDVKEAVQTIKIYQQLC